MSEAVKAPTLLVGIGEFGEAVLSRLEAEVRPLGAVPVRTCLIRSNEALPPIEESLYALVDALVRTRLGRVGVRRLDVAVIADLVEPGSAARSQAVIALLNRVFGKFAEALRMSKSVGDRAITMVAIYAAPPLLSMEDVRPINDLERWHQAQSLRALSRIFVISRQHEGGTLTDEDLRRSVFLLVVSAYLSGLRDHDTVSGRLAHRNDAELVSLANAAAADVPVEAVVSYCAWRTALAGLDTLTARCATPAGAGAGDHARAQLDYERWIAPLADGEAARKARTWDSGSLSPVAPGVPDAFPWTADGPTIEAQVTPLSRFARGLDTAATPARRRQVDDATLVALDRAELAQLEDAAERLDKFLLTELEPDNGLERLPRTAAALDTVEQWLLERARAPLVEPRPDVAAAPTDGPRDELDALDAALVERPSASGLVLKALALGLLAAVLVAGIVLTMKAAPAGPVAVPTPGGVAGTVQIKKAAGAGSTAAPWAVIVPVAVTMLLVSLGWLGGRAMAMGKRMRGAVEALKSAATAERRGGRAGGTASEAALSLRERRLARTLLQRVIAARQRVAGLRTAVSAARERARQELRTLGYVAAEGRRPDDASGVLGPESPLHRHLVGAEDMDGLWRATRHIREEERWASLLLRAAWPYAGLTSDLPFDDSEEPDTGQAFDRAATWASVTCVEQHRSLQESAAFAWPQVRETVAANLRDFLIQAVDPAVVGLGVAPADEHGQPLPSNAKASFVVVAPAAAKAILSTLGTARFPFEQAVATTPVSRVVVLRTHPGCSARHLFWGIDARRKR